MVRILVRMTACLSILIYVSAAQAADYSRPYNQCVPLQPADLLMVDDLGTLTDEVVTMMNMAIQVAEDPEWTAYSRPAWTWATEASVACGKAYGYLRNSYRDEQYLNKCECFYERMQSFMN